MEGFRRSVIRIAVAAAAAAILLWLPSGAGASVTGPNPCPSQPAYSWYGDSVSEAQAIPSVANEGLTYPSSVLRPADTVAYPGKRPVIVIQHGRGGDRCSLWWVAQFMAGHGYVVEIHAAPPSPVDVTAFTNAVEATRSAFAFIKSDANPFAAYTDLEHMGLTGHSLGSAVTAFLQGDTSLGIDAVIASDNLRRYLQGDPGGSNNECAVAPNVEVTPTVPALGFAKDEPCNSKPDVTDPEIKQYGWSWWRSNAMPSVELVMRGYNHGDFAGGGGETKKHDLSHWYEAWFDHWLLGEPADPILATEVNGRPTADILSSHYLSAACMPGLADTADLSGWLTAGKPALQAKGACDTASTPAPDPRPVEPVTQNPGRPDPSHPFVYGPRRIRAGKVVVLKIQIRNAGPVAATGIVAHLKDDNRRVHTPRLVRFGQVPARGSKMMRVKVRAKPRAGGKVRIVVRSSGGKTARTLRIIHRG